MKQNADNDIDGAILLPDFGTEIFDHTSDLFHKTNRAAHLSALGIFIRNFPLEVFDEEERTWFLSFEARVCRLETEAFNNLTLE